MHQCIFFWEARGGLPPGAPGRGRRAHGLAPRSQGLLLNSLRCIIRFYNHNATARGQDLPGRSSMGVYWSHEWTPHSMGENVAGHAGLAGFCRLWSLGPGARPYHCSRPIERRLGRTFSQGGARDSLYPRAPPPGGPCVDSPRSWGTSENNRKSNAITGLTADRPAKQLIDQNQAVGTGLVPGQSNRVPAPRAEGK